MIACTLLSIYLLSSFCEANDVSNRHKVYYLKVGKKKTVTIVMSDDL